MLTTVQQICAGSLDVVIRIYNSKSINDAAKKESVFDENSLFNDDCSDQPDILCFQVSALFWTLETSGESEINFRRLS